MKVLVYSMFLCCLILPACRTGKDTIPSITYDKVTCIKTVTNEVYDSIDVSINYFSLFPLSRHRSTTLITSPGEKLISFTITRPELVTFIVDLKDTLHTFLIPGDTLAIRLTQTRVDQNEARTAWSVDNEVFDYCQAKFKRFGYVEMSDNYSPFAVKYLYRPGISKKRYTQVNDIIGKEEALNSEFLSEYKGKVPEWFRTMEKVNILYSAAECRLILFGDLTDYTHREELPVSVPLNNPDASLSPYYYSFLSDYFLYGFPGYGTFSYVKRLSSIFDLQRHKVDSILTGEMKTHYITCYISNLYLFQESTYDLSIADSLYQRTGDILSGSERKFILKKRAEGLRLMPVSRPARGEKTPDFPVQDTEGHIHRLSEYRGKMVYLHFWATWCGPCVEELPEINSLAGILDKKDLIILNVCLDFAPKKWKNIISDNKLEGINLIADDSTYQAITELYNITSVPRYCLIDRDGIIISGAFERPAVARDSIMAYLGK